MAIKVFRPALLKINAVDIPFTNVTVNPGFTELLLQNGIQVDPTYVGVNDVAPIISGETMQLNTLIGTVGFDGLTLTAFEVWMVEVDAGPVAALSNTAVKISGTGGLAVITNISGNGGETSTPATGSFELHALGDATNSPLIIESAQAPPTAVETTAVYYLADTVFVGATYDPTSVTIDFGLEVTKRKGSGVEWPTYVGVPRRLAQINVTTENSIALDDLSGAISNEVEGQDVADVAIFFRKGTIGVPRVAAATAVHFKITAAKAFVTPGNAQGALDGFSTQDVVIRPLSTAGGDSLVYTDTVALP